MPIADIEHISSLHSAGAATGEPTEHPCNDQDRFLLAADELPKLTRVVLMLSARDDLKYDEIALRCGISTAEVQLRLGSALWRLRRSMRGRPSLFGRIRRASLPWRGEFARARLREVVRRLSPQSSQTPKRTTIDRLAQVYELIRQSV